MIQKKILFIAFLFLSACSFAQEERLTDKNNINWLAYTGNVKLNDKFSIHTEYQWRRTNGLKHWQQGLFRTGLNYALTKNVNLIAGYAFAETYVYGDYPTPFAFPEHRLFEQLLIKNPLGKVNLSHRFMLEQRFVGSVSMQNGSKETDYNYLNRMRYRARVEIPLQKNIEANKWSLILQDEVFIGWGNNIGANIFDQNRVGVFAGYKVSDLLKLEAGYINQTLQQGKRVAGKPVFQHNNGLVLGANFSFDFRQKN